MVMQAAADFLVGGLNPVAANMAAAPPPATDLKFCTRVRYHSTKAGVTKMCLPIAWSLLSENFDPTPTPNPPEKKCYPVSGDGGLRIKTSIGGLSYWQKNDFTRGWTSNIMPWGMLRE